MLMKRGQRGLKKERGGANYWRASFNKESERGQGGGASHSSARRERRISHHRVSEDHFGGGGRPCLQKETLFSRKDSTSYVPHLQKVGGVL